MKKCSKCGEKKEFAEFYKNKSHKDEKRSACKECEKKYDHEWYIKNKEKCSECGRKWYIKNKEKYREYSQKYYAEHKGKWLEYNQQWRIQNREKCVDFVRHWRIKYPEKAKENSRKGNAKQRSTSEGRLNDCIRVGIRQSLKGSKGGHHWETLVGYSIGQLKKHLEKQFLPNMNWENYGKGWVIDHKIPIKVFNFKKPEDLDFKRCWGLKNLQPLWAKENSLKRAKIEEPFQPSLIF